MEQITELRKVNSGPWVNGLHLSCIFVMRRIQPLMLHDHPMWEYTGMKDTTRTKNNELSPDEFDARIRAITNIDREPELDLHFSDTGSHFLDICR